MQLAQQTVKLLTGTNGNDVASDPWAGSSTTGIDQQLSQQDVLQCRDRALRDLVAAVRLGGIGGLENRMNKTTQKTVALTTGFNGGFGEDWGWEAAYNHSEYKADVDMPRISAAAANEFFLGPRLGYDDDGYAIYDADPTRLFLAGAHPGAVRDLRGDVELAPGGQNDNLSFTTDTTTLFTAGRRRGLRRRRRIRAARATTSIRIRWR